jgi:hypothetical protein
MIINVPVGSGFSSARGSKWQAGAADVAIVGTVTVGGSDPQHSAATQITQMLEGTSTPETSIPTGDLFMDDWSEEYEQRFHKLLSAKALRGLSLDEAREYGSLQAARRIAYDTRKPEEIIREHKRHKASMALVAAITEYVTLFSVEDNSR